MEEPKNGADILVEMDTKDGQGTRDIVLLSIRRPKMSPGWCIISNGVSLLNAPSWSQVVDFFLGRNVAILEKEAV